MAQKITSPSIAIQIAANRIRTLNRRTTGADRGPGSVTSAAARVLMALSPP
jgi:hypothetical protein